MRESYTIYDSYLFDMKCDKLVAIRADRYFVNFKEGNSVLDLHIF